MEHGPLRRRGGGGGGRRRGGRGGGVGEGKIIPYSEKGEGRSLKEEQKHDISSLQNSLTMKFPWIGTAICGRVPLNTVSTRDQQALLFPVPLKE